MMMTLSSGPAANVADQVTDGTHHLPDATQPPTPDATQLSTVAASDPNGTPHGNTPKRPLFRSFVEGLPPYLKPRPSTNTLRTHSRNNSFARDASSGDTNTPKTSAEDQDSASSEDDTPSSTSDGARKGEKTEGRRFFLGHRPSPSQSDEKPTEKVPSENWNVQRLHFPQLGDYVPQELSYHDLSCEYRISTPGPYPLNWNRSTLTTQQQNEILFWRLSGGATMFPCANAPRSVLDLGCGEGWWATNAAKIWTNTHFVALDMTNVHSLKLKEKKNITPVCCNFLTHTLPFADESFDFVRLSGPQLALREGGDYQFLFREARRVLRVGGRLEVIIDDLIFPYGGRIVEGAPLPKSLACSHLGELLAQGEANPVPADISWKRSSRPLSRIIEDDEGVMSIEQLLAQSQPWPDNKPVPPSGFDATPACTPTIETPETPSTPSTSQWKNKQPLIKLPSLLKITWETQPVKVIDPEPREELLVASNEGDDAGKVSEPQVYVQICFKLPKWERPPAVEEDPVLDIAHDAFAVRPGLAAGQTPADRASAGPGCVSVSLAWLEGLNKSLSIERNFLEIRANNNLPEHPHIVARKALLDVFGVDSVHEMLPYEVMLAPPDAALRHKPKSKRESMLELSEDDESFLGPSGTTPSPAPTSASPPATDPATPVIPRPPRSSSLPRRRSSVRRSASTDTLRPGSVGVDDEDDEELDFGCGMSSSSRTPHRPTPGLVVWPSRYIPMSELEVEYHASAGPSNVFAARGPLRGYALSRTQSTDDMEALLEDYEEFRRARFLWRTSADASAGRTPQLSDIRVLEKREMMGYDLSTTFGKEVPYERDSLVHIRTIRPFLAIKTRSSA
ncbi:uncharacterized protein SCHCODRAFT_02679866 [Schizophyllum commune H4-8]|uniref:Methyltransferase domain-containing protein n=1 Tax=Schizophyllum commune (strain H4-8 / FGSC 9210) TaxID=578458 RepID=D8QBI9_SCHCM|nr:uncharacterized protein SCHCODRAFT_02679866 [Schizophyllum commune H4-8]KAI5889193.1 hypothetical protein SCHCODRAFT_02679866 [Schizophyllum commune H4-8]